MEFKLETAKWQVAKDDPERELLARDGFVFDENDFHTNSPVIEVQSLEGLLELSKKYGCPMIVDAEGPTITIYNDCLD